MRVVFFILVLIIAAGVGLYVFPSDVREAIENTNPPLSVEPPDLSDDLPFTLPDGFAVAVFADSVPGVRDITRDPHATIVASLTDSGRVVALPDLDGDQRADSVVTILDGLRKPHGIVFNCPEVPPTPCALYVAEEHRVGAYSYDAVNRTATFEKTLAELPTGGGHSTRSLLLHPNGRELLVSIGSSCNVCNESDERRAAILSIDLESGAVTNFARGLRNTVFMTMHPVSGALWGTDMGRDWLGDNLPPDEVNILREAANYGWPICYGKNIHDTEFDKNTYVRPPCREPFETPSHLDIPAHSAPLGLTFIPEKGWPEEWWHDLLVAYHGSWNRSEPTGYKIVKFDLDAQGRPRGPAEDFLTGFISDDGTVRGRPVDLHIEPGGTLFITDDGAGRIYRVFRTSEN